MRNDMTHEFLNGYSRKNGHKQMNNPNSVFHMTPSKAGWYITRVGQFDYGDHLENDELIEKDQLPKELRVIMMLPGITDPNVIDLQVVPRSVNVRAKSPLFIHNFSIPLPFEVVTNAELKASWNAKNYQLTLTLLVKAPHKVRKQFIEPGQEHEEEEPEKPTSKIEELSSEVTTEQTEKKPVEKKKKDNTIKEANFLLTFEEKVVTVVLYVPKIETETIRIENGIELFFTDRAGQQYHAALNPPYPLHSVPIMKPVGFHLTLIFIEEEEKPEEQEEPKEEEKKPGIPEDLPMILKNKYIFELEP